MLDAVDNGWLNQLHTCLCSPQCMPSIAQLVHPSQRTPMPNFPVFLESRIQPFPLPIKPLWIHLRQLSPAREGAQACFY